MSGDVNAILRAFLLTQVALTGVVGTRIYTPRLPEGATTLPALGFFVRGGGSNMYTKEYVDPSFQFDCWGNTSVEARSVYQALYDVLQGIGGYYNVYRSVAIGANTYYICSAREEGSGQDVLEINPQNYYRVLAYFKVKIKIS